MGKYVVGPCVLSLTGHPMSAKEGDIVEHDFSVQGPDGVHGPARETALIAAGALTPTEDHQSQDRSSARRQLDGPKEE